MNTVKMYWLYSGIKNVNSSATVYNSIYTLFTIKYLKMINRLAESARSESFGNFYT